MAICINGHDKVIFGTLVSGGCRQCGRERNHRQEAKLTAKRRGAKKALLASGKATCPSGHLRSLVPPLPDGSCRICARINRQSRRARQRAAFVERVDGVKLFARDNGICGICGYPVKTEEFQIDHIVPLALGGSHSYANTQVAHPRCNHVKGARKATRLLAPIVSIITL